MEGVEPGAFGRGARVYVDANIFIYLVEAAPRFADMVRAVFLALEAAEARVMTSGLAVAECLYLPAKCDNARAVEAYERLFSSGEAEILALDGGLAKRAAMLGGKLGLKLFDAIHYISALQSGCGFFITNDLKFKSGPKMRVIHLRA